LVLSDWLTAGIDTDDSFWILALTPFGNKKPLSMLIAVAWVLLALGNGEGLFLCFGNDGHVSLETGNQGACCDFLLDRGLQRNLDQVLPATDTDSRSPCGDCLDIPMSTGSKAVFSKKVRNQRPRQHPQTVHWTACEAHPTNILGDPWDGALAPIPFSSSLIHPILSCTVLLI